MSRVVFRGTCSPRPLTSVTLMGKLLDCSSTSWDRVATSSPSVSEGLYALLGSTQSSRHMLDRNLLAWLETGRVLGPGVMVVGVVVGVAEELCCGNVAVIRVCC